MIKEMLLAALIVSIAAANAAAAFPEAGLNVTLNVDSVCPCSTIGSDVGDIEVEVTNLDDQEATYDLELVLPDDDMWSGLINPSITLAAGETRDVKGVFVTPSCWVSPGTYTIAVVASSDISGKVTVAEFELDVAKCRWIGIEADSYAVCQGKESRFDVLFRNEGFEKEDVKVSTDVDWAVFPEDEFSLAADEEVTKELVLTPPADLEGIGDMTITAESDTSYVRNTEVSEIYVMGCYGTEFAVEPDRQDVCPCKDANFTISLNNTGLYDDNYTIEYGGKAVDVPLDSGSMAQVALSVGVACDRESGEYPLDISISSRDPTAPHSASVTIGVYPLDECYSVDLVPEDNDSVTLRAGESKTFMVVVGNSGKFTQEYNITLEAPDWVHLSEDSAVLEPGYGAEIYMYVAPAYRTAEGNYTITLAAASGNEMDEAAFKISVISDFEENGTVEVNTTIPTGEVTGTDRPWSQIIMITILAIGVVFVLILRFVVMMK